MRKGVKPEKLLVTGLPNFDHAAQYLENAFPSRDYVLVATSDARETFKGDNRQKFLRWAVELAGARPLIFKLHPNENVARAVEEIQDMAPQARIYVEGNVEPMIANCAVLITQYSSCIYHGLALGKECYSYFDLEMLQRLAPLQNGGSSGYLISLVCRKALGENVDILSANNKCLGVSGIQGTDRGRSRGFQTLRKLIKEVPCARFGDLNRLR